MDRETDKDTLQDTTTLDAFLGREPRSARATLLRKWHWRAVGILLIALLVYWFAGRGDEQPNYATAPVQRGDLRVTVSATGNLQPTNEVQVGSEQSGLVTQVVRRQ